MTKVQVRGRTKTITFVYMHSGAKHMLSLAERSEDGQLYTLTACLVYCAFTLEAYLNHLGALRHPDWEATERRRSKRRKYEALASEVGVKVDFEARPYATMLTLFAFRDRMAHGRTEKDNVFKFIDIDGPRLPQIVGDTEWQAYATTENARQAMKDVEALVKELHNACGYPGNPFGSAGGGVYSLVRS